MPRVNKKAELFDTVRAKHEAGATLVAIGEELGINPVTLGRWFREEGVKVIQRGRKKEPEKWVEHVCEQCGKTFSIQQSQRRRFCSRECTNNWQRENAAAHARRCEGCGGPIELQPGAKYKYTYRKYCSDECRAKYGAKRQKDPAKWVTFDCETCGNETTKRISSSNQNRFCSNECAAKHTKVVRHYACREADMVLDSTWEMLFAGLMGFRRIPCERYDRKYAVAWAPDQWYAPDFWLPNIGMAVEVKGVEDEHDAERWAAYRERFGLLAVLGRKEMERLVKSPSEIWLGNLAVRQARS